MNNVVSFLQGGGKMGARMREKDWTKSSLGPPGDWPQSLKTVVSVMLGNRFPMYIAWGPDFIQLFNDAYLSILGPERELSALK